MVVKHDSLKAPPAFCTCGFLENFLGPVCAAAAAIEANLLSSTTFNPQGCPMGVAQKCHTGTDIRPARGMPHTAHLGTDIRPARGMPHTAHFDQFMLGLMMNTAGIFLHEPLKNYKGVQKKSGNEEQFHFFRGAGRSPVRTMLMLSASVRPPVNK
eukprot:scaffold221198_cov22-Tisochrysis_lutea.AAC.1